MGKTVKNNFDKTDFIKYLASKIPSYLMPADKFFTSFNREVKKFAKEKGHPINIILEVKDTNLLVEWLNEMRYLRSKNGRGYESKKEKGLRYYLEYLKETDSIDRNKIPHSDIVEQEKKLLTKEEVLLKAQEGMMKETAYFHRRRNRGLRNECAKKYEYKCCVCGFDFEATYGDRGHEFIEVHHLKPLASYDGEHEISLDELCALCSNCHSMIHRGKEIMDIEALKKIVKERSDNSTIFI